MVEQPLRQRNQGKALAESGLDAPIISAVTGRRSFQAAILVIVGLIVALGAAEVTLRLLQSGPDGQHMDNGLLEHHPRFGWQLARNWQGTHVHPDYSARYRTTPFRTRSTGGVAHGAGQLVLIGDSFTFGLGVSDESTFAGLLQGVADHPVSNHGLPGASPDQQLLRLEPMNLGRTERLVFVVFLGNDLLDLTRHVPLQAPHGKPRYELNAGRLQVTNVPVPATPKQAAAAHKSITSYLLAGSGWDSQLALVRYLRRVLPPPAVELSPWFAERFKHEHQLFDAIVERLELSLRSRSVQLSIAVLPGRELIAEPDSVFASYQHHAGRVVATVARQHDVPLINLGQGLGLSDYFQNDGHLTSHGHCKVAQQLAAELGYATPAC